MRKVNHVLSSIYLCTCLVVASNARVQINTGFFDISNPINIGNFDISKTMEYASNLSKDALNDVTNILYPKSGNVTYRFLVVSTNNIIHTDRLNNAIRGPFLILEAHCEQFLRFEQCIENSASCKFCNKIRGNPENCDPNN